MESDTDTDYDCRTDFSSTQEFKKMKNTLLLSGYREGAVAGKDKSFQQGFDKGYAGGFEAGYTLGICNGIFETLKENSQLFSVDSKLLEGKSFKNSRHGLCQLCDKNNAASSSEVLPPKSENFQRRSVGELLKVQEELVSSTLDEHKLEWKTQFQNKQLRDLLKIEK